MKPDALPPTPVKPQVLSGEMTGMEVGFRDIDEVVAVVLMTGIEVAPGAMNEVVVLMMTEEEELGPGVAGLLGRLPIFDDNTFELLFK